MVSHEIRVIDFIRQHGRAYAFLIAIAGVIMIVAHSWNLDPAVRHDLYAVSTGIVALLIFWTLAPHEVPWSTYVRNHWRKYIGASALAVLLVVAAHRWKPDAGIQQVLYAVVAGIVGLLIFQVLTDYNNMKFVAHILDDHQLSFHVGARLYESHRGIITREKAIQDFVKGKDVIRLLTSTADNYILSYGDANHAVREKLVEGAKLQILLFTPIYNLRSYLDARTGPGGEGHPQSDESQTHGQSHRHASELVYDQRDKIIPAIERLNRDFPGKVEARFFHIRHHINMVIYGSRRIFSAPLLLGTEGSNLPCLEVFPGLTSAALFEKLVEEFNYIWDKRYLTFSLQEMKDIYDFIADYYPTYLTAHWIDAAGAEKIEEHAREVVLARSGSMPAVPNPAPSPPATPAQLPNQVESGEPAGEDS